MYRIVDELSWLREDECKTCICKKQVACLPPCNECVNYSEAVRDETLKGKRNERQEQACSHCWK